MNEQWRDVVGFEGKYAVSDRGRVWSHVKSKYLRPGNTTAGYPSVVLGRGNTRFVHRLVAEAFLGPVPNGQEVRHKNGKRSDCNLSNLHFGSRSDNNRDRVHHGTRKLTPEEVREVRRKPWVRGSGAELARKFGVSESLISIVRSGSARHYGVSVE